MSYSETTQSITFAPHNSSFWQKLYTHYHNWQIRRKIRAMSELDDRMLDDIGVTYDDVVWASKLPLNINAAFEMDRISKRRRRQARQTWYASTPVR